MRMYLSSFRIGAQPQRLLELLGPGRRCALVPNAVDAVPEEVSAPHLRRDVDELKALGLEVTFVDLRAPGAAGYLAGHDLVWVRGGNSFVLRRALADSGADEALLALLRA